MLCSCKCTLVYVSVAQNHTNLRCTCLQVCRCPSQTTSIYQHMCQTTFIYQHMCQIMPMHPNLFNRMHNSIHLVHIRFPPFTRFADDMSVPNRHSNARTGWIDCGLHACWEVACQKTSQPGLSGCWPAASDNSSWLRISPKRASATELTSHGQNLNKHSFQRCILSKSFFQMGIFFESH